ncbi:hypothetical protein NDU88_003066 [Pleurodeles waltl]|uniref:Uncharacterized protein n=1 Tax=Pleurodeles waltl TaxID=8319 RepID=A0AAV7T490_PLEWA|nr:hypothetical protein NDU88_003066 [Pleurodeles waltl]
MSSSSRAQGSKGQIPPICRSTYRTTPIQANPSQSPAASRQAKWLQPGSAVRPPNSPPALLGTKKYPPRKRPPKLTGATLGEGSPQAGNARSRLRGRPASRPCGNRLPKCIRDPQAWRAETTKRRRGRSPNPPPIGPPGALR